MRYNLLALIFVLVLSSCVKVPTPEQQAQNIYSSTGLKPVSLKDTKGSYLGKTHNGYDVIAYFEMGNVWGRYAARLAMGEIGREVKGIFGFLTGSGEYVGSVAGSPLDRLLSQAIGQPISMMFVLKLNKPSKTRVDVYSMFSNIKPYDPQPEIKFIGLNAGTLYSNNNAVAQKILADEELMKKIGYMRSMYIRADDKAVTFAFSGSENDYSYMIREAGSYENLLNAILDTLSGIADKV